MAALFSMSTIRDSSRPGTIEIYGANLEVEIQAVIADYSEGWFPLKRLLTKFPAFAMWEVVQAIKVLQHNGGPGLCADCRHLILERKFRHAEDCGLGKARIRRMNALIQGDL